jgi:cytochrome oxidase Cu insertion factor (SCO1/SenC/PrrC family)
VRPILTRRACLQAMVSGGVLCAAPGLAQSVGGGDPPLPGLGGDIRLTDQQGQAFVLSQQPPRATLIFFGFTQCAQVCPPALTTMQALATRPQAGEPVRMLFITLDPLNDAPQALQHYLRGFGGQITGLTGSPAQIEDVARRYGVRTTSQNGVLDHSARLYLLGKDHRLQRVYRLQTPVAQLARDIVAVQSGRAYFD